MRGRDIRPLWLFGREFASMASVKRRVGVPHNLAVGGRLLPFEQASLNLRLWGTLPRRGGDHDHRCW